MVAPHVSPGRRRWTPATVGVAAAAGFVAALVGLPATVHAMGQPDELRELAADAAHAVAEERALVAIAATVEATPGLLAAVHARLADVDAAGAVLLTELDAAGAQLPGVVRNALSALAADGAGAPSDSTYRAAVAELLDLTTQPVRVVNVPVEPQGIGFATLVIVALMFVALGLTALLFTLRSARPRRELSALAWSDALTGLANRRRLDHDLRERALGTGAARGRHPVSGPTAVIMVDIDHFKDINDSHGHRYGDDVLRAVGAMLTREVRRDDVVYRYGGEEFCIVLPGAGDSDAARVADRIVAAARRLELPGGVKVTLSAGVADGTGADIERTLHAADDALLTAKRTGRNRTALPTPA
ncbi:MAG TPA: GGDEF domain-containing protein [Ilumatobacter sp.]|nr:GGDEF domain-containing protein [Ilumatobacter sp.]